MLADTTILRQCAQLESSLVARGVEKEEATLRAAAAYNYRVGRIEAAFSLHDKVRDLRRRRRLIYALGM